MGCLTPENALAKSPARALQIRLNSYAALDKGFEFRRAETPRGASVSLFTRGQKWDQPAKSRCSET